MYSAFIQEVLVDAAKIARDHFGQVSSTVKPEDNNQVLTEADIAIGKALVDAVQKKYPDHSIIDEEAGVIDNQSTITWVIDPIDGTSNFAAGTPLYGCMIGVLENDIPIAGGVVLPALDQLYIAEKGQGATCNGAPLSVTNQPSLLQCLVAYGVDGHQENPLQTRKEAEILGDIILAIRNLRSSNSVFDLMMTACGSYGAFLNQNSKIWDNVAPQIIIEEAGGVYTDFFGQSIDYHDAVHRANENFTVCAASPVLHAELQKIIENHR